MKRTITSIVLIFFIATAMISCPDEPLKIEFLNKSNPLHLIIPAGTTAIPANAYQKKGYTKLTIADSIKTIGDRAFYTNKLTTVTIPDSVTIIGDYAFADNNLNSVTIPDSVTIIGDYAFADNNLTKVILSKTLSNKYNKEGRENRFGSTATYYYLNSFTDKPDPLHLIIPSGTTAITAYEYEEKGYTKLTIPDSVTEIGDYAFVSNKLTRVTIPDSVIEIGDYAFADNNLIKVILSKTLSNKYNKEGRENRFGSTATYYYLNEFKDKKSILILTMEGGGILGIMQVQFLMDLEKETKKISEMFDFFAGTSIGGVHALFFAVYSEKQAADLMGFYNQANYTRIFDSTGSISNNEREVEIAIPVPVIGNIMVPYTLRELYDSHIARNAARWGLTLPPWESIPPLWEAKYPGTGKSEAMDVFFGDKKLKDAKKGVLVSAYRLDAEDHAFYFSSYDSEDSVQEIRAADIADATSAAPLYFPFKTIGTGDNTMHFTDGALIANNLCAKAIDTANNHGYANDEIKVLSLGTVRMTGKMDNEEVGTLRTAGLVGLATRGKIMQRLYEGAALHAISSCKYTLKDNFLHILFDYNPSSISIDDHSDEAIRLMGESAKRAFTANKKKVLNFIKR